MVMVVLDSTNTAAVLADAVGEAPLDLPVNDNAAEAAVEAPAKVETAPEADDVEGDDGLTPRQKREFTASMLKTIGKKHGMLKEAEEFAKAQIFERRAVERRAIELEQEVERLRSAAKPAEPVVEPTEPKREAFQTDEAFQDAIMDWKVDQRFKAREAETAREAAEVRQAQVVADASARIAHAISIVPDFVAVTEAVDMRVPDLIAGAMQESELFAEIGYHFAKHPETLEELRLMSPAKSLVALGKIEAKLQPFAPVAKVDAKSDNGVKPSAPNGTLPSSKTESLPSRPRATAPITPLSSASSVQVVKDETDMNVREVITDWSRKNKVNLSRRQRH